MSSMIEAIKELEVDESEVYLSSIVVVCSVPTRGCCLSKSVQLRDILI